MVRWFTKFSVVLCALAAPALANPRTPPDTIDMAHGVRAAVWAAPGQFTEADSGESPYIYLNRCIGGCQIIGTGPGGVTDARSQMTFIPPNPGNYTVTEFANLFGQTSEMGGTCLGDMTTPCTSDTQCAGMTPTTCDTADYEWGLVVQCMKEVYSPYAVILSDTPPTGGVSYTEAIIAGQPTDIGEPTNDLGIAPIACTPQNNVISFSFANHHAAQDHAYNVCWTAAQETAHAFSLDHEYSFIGAYDANQNSACMDPMTYRTDCGGEKFFRNATANCGTFTEAASCICGGTQNSHQKLLTVFPAGQSIIPPPTSMITFPAANASVATNFPVDAMAGSRRGVEVVELWLNGYKWLSTPGSAFGGEGQPNPSNYTITTPSNLPDGYIDIVAKAYDDLNIETDSATVTVLKGAPCTDDTTCLLGQMCGNGRCAWPTPTGQLGDKCDYPQFCVSGVCSGTSTDQICTQNCTVGIDEACPDKYECVPTSGTSGICFPGSSGGGCCSADGAGAGWGHAGLAGIVLAGMLRRRRRPQR